MRNVQVGGEPGGGPLGSSYEKLYADVMMTRKGKDLLWVSVVWKGPEKWKVLATPSPGDGVS